MINRRGFLAGLGSLLAAPAVVQATSLMPIGAIPGGPDFSMAELKVIAEERFKMGLADWRGIFGTFEDRWEKNERGLLIPRYAAFRL